MIKNKIIKRVLSVVLFVVLTMCSIPVCAAPSSESEEYVTAVSLGGNHSAAIKSDGSLWMWGANYHGQLGDGTMDSKSEPIKVMENVTAVSLGYNRSAAIKNDGSLWMWGSNTDGQLGDGTTDSKSEPIKVMENVTAVSLGGDHSAAIKSDGSLWMWGNNRFAQLGDRTTDSRSKPIKVMENVTAVSLGSSHSAAIKSDGSLWMWGFNSCGEVGDGTTTGTFRREPVKIMENVTAVSLGYNHSAAVKNDGSLWTWGYNNHGQLGDGTTDSKSEPIKVMENVAAVDLGKGSHSAAIKNDGSLWTWGYNYYGQLGDGTEINRSTPAKVLENVATVSLGEEHSAAVKSDGSLWMWGFNYNGQLGDGTNVSKLSPVCIISGNKKDNNDNDNKGNDLVNVYFDATEGSFITTDDYSQTVHIGEKLSAPPNPFKMYYEFVGWYKDSDCKDIWDFATDTVSQEMTLYAKWNYKGMEQKQRKYPSLSELDKELIRKVSLYTSDDGPAYIQVLQKLMELTENSNLSIEEKLKIHNDFFVERGFSDVHEGVNYVRDATFAKRAFDFLTDDELFLAYQYNKYLAENPQIKVLLLSSGWIFNDDLVQYINPSTYITQETNSIKNYKTMLLKFMEADTLKYENIEYSKNIKKLVKGIVDTYDGSVTEELTKEFNDSLAKCNTTNEMDAVFARWLREYDTKTGRDGKLEIHLKGYNNVSDAMGYAGEFLTVYGETCDDFTTFALLETKVEVLNRYKTFLKEIQEGEEVLPYGLVVAAQQLESEMILPYETQIFKIMGQVGNHLTKNKYLNLKDLVVEKIGGKALGSLVATVELSALIVDGLTGIGDLVKNSACVEAYSYLSMYYSTLLKQRKADFLKSKTLENAWAFYDTYQLLFNLRESGEIAYFDMNKEPLLVKAVNGTYQLLSNIREGSKDAYSYITILNPLQVISIELLHNLFGTQDKEKFVKERLDYMNEYCAFELDNAEDIDESHMYARKAVIKCPVDVLVYDSNGNKVYTISDGTELDETNSIGRFICWYDPYLGEYIKAVYLENDIYNICLRGTDAGNVSVFTAKQGSLTTYGVTGLKTCENSEISLDFTNNNYSSRYDNDNGYNYSGKLIEYNDETSGGATSLLLSEKEKTMCKGETTSISVTAYPALADYQTVEWKSGDESVVVVDKGKIEAVGVGKTTVTAFCGNISDECVITVVENNSDSPNNPEDNRNDPGNSGENGNENAGNPSVAVDTTKIDTRFKTTTNIKGIMLSLYKKKAPDAVVKKIKFKSSNKKIVKVNKKGIAKGGKQSGSATITMYVKTVDTITKPNGKQKKKVSTWTSACDLDVNNTGKPGK